MAAGRIFSTGVLVILGLGVLGSLGYGGYYLGTQKQIPPETVLPTTPPKVTMTATPVITPTIGPSPTLAATPTLIPQSWTMKEKIGGNTTFVGFSVYLPPGWSVQKSTLDGGVKVAISSANYQIMISQAAGGGGLCIYPGQIAQPMSVPFNKPTKVLGYPGSDTAFNRATQPGEPDPSTLTYLLCQLKGSSYVTPTDYGYISYTVPQNPDQDKLGEMDAIVGMIH